MRIYLSIPFGSYLYLLNLLLISVFIIIISICVPGLPTYIQKYISSSIMGLFILSILSILKLIVDIYIFLIENIK